LLADHPSFRVCRFALLEISEAIDFGKKPLRNSWTPRAQRVSNWLQLLNECLLRAGGISGTGDVSRQIVLEPKYSAKPYKFDGFPKRDERFPDPYNMGVNAEVFLYDEKFPPEPKTLMMFYKRLREIDVPEMMASIIVETPDKPWGYYAGHDAATLG
jgi:hypothetical protein